MTLVHIPVTLNTRPSVIGAVPLLFIVLYMAFCFGLFLWGPVAWNVTDLGQLTIFLILSMAGLAFGYFIGMFVEPGTSGREVVAWRAILRIGAIASVVLLAPTTMIVADKMPWEAWRAVFCQDKAYQNMLLTGQSAHTAWSQIFALSRAICAPFMYAVLPLAILYASKLKKTDWVFVAIYVLCLCTVSAIRGTDKETGDLVIVFLSMALLFFYRFVVAKNISGRNFLLLVSAAVFVCAAGATVFEYRKQSRMEGTCSIYCDCVPAPVRATQAKAPTLTASNAQTPAVPASLSPTERAVPAPLSSSPPKAGSDSGGAQTRSEQPKHTPVAPTSGQRAPRVPLSLPLPKASYDPSRSYGPYNLALASAYLTQGFYGLSLAFDEPFDSTYGLGHSPLVISLIGQKIIPNIESRTYTHKIALRGWDDRGHWATALLWIANDVGFGGVPIVLALFGFVFAICWRDAVAEGTSATILFTLLMVFVFFMPANNQLLLTLNSYVSFVFWFAIWVFGRARRGLRRSDLHSTSLTES